MIFQNYKTSSNIYNVHVYAFSHLKPNHSRLKSNELLRQQHQHHTHLSIIPIPSQNTLGASQFQNET